MDRKCTCNHRHSNNNGQGFLLGVLVGIIATLLFTTKKGREILKDLTEKGLDKLSDIQKTVNENAPDAVTKAADVASEVIDKAQAAVGVAVTKVEDVANDVEEQLEEFSDAENMDYVDPELRGEELSAVAEDSFGDAQEETLNPSISSNSSAVEEAVSDEKIEKEEVEKKPKILTAKVKKDKEIEASKTGLHGTVKHVPASKRFFMRRAKKS